MPALGDLEVRVLEHLWASGPVTAKDAHAVLGPARGISLNTVQSTLERLFRKALLDRSKRGHAYRYAPAVTREALIATLMTQVADRLGGDAAASLAAFVEGADGIDEAALDALEAALQRRRERSG
jgi:predicted transcriptional regulator